MAANLTPLVGLQTARKGEPREGDLVTVLLARSLDGSVPSVEAGARIVRIAYGTYFVRLVGLSVPAGCKVGDPFPLSREAIIDW